MLRGLTVQMGFPYLTAMLSACFRSRLTVNRVIVCCAAVIAGSLVAADAASARAAQKTKTQKAVPAQSAKPQTPTQQAAALVAAGNAADALPIIDKVLADAPANRDALIVKIDALVSLDRTPDAAGVYDAFAGSSGKHDPALARHLARTELQHLASSGSRPDVKDTASEALRKAGETVPKSVETAASAPASSAKSKTGQAGQASVPGAPTSPTLKTPEEILASDSAPIDLRISALDRLRAPVSDRTRQLVRGALTTAAPSLKMAAIDAAVRLQLRELAPELRVSLQDAFFPVKLKSAAALHQFGDHAGDQMLQDTLKGDFLAARLVAARALRTTGDKSWIPAITPLLESPRPHERVLAAELLVDSDKSAEALNLLRTSIKGDDPPVRAEAARVLAAQPQADPWDFLPLMKDPNPAVRAQAASVILRTLPGATAARATPSSSHPAPASRHK